MIGDIIYKLRRKKIDPTKPYIRKYKIIGHEERLLLLNSVPENMKNLTFLNKMKVKFINYFKFLSMPSFIKGMVFWLFLDIIVFNCFTFYFILFYFIFSKYLVTVIFVEHAGKKNRYFKTLKYEIVKKKYKDEVILGSLILFIPLAIYFLDPMFFLTLLEIVLNAGK